MLKSILFTVLLLSCLQSFAETQTAIGFKEIRVADSQGKRPLHVSLWYPTNDQRAMNTIAENQAFYGFQAIREAQPSEKKHPLIVLSHGYGGSWRNLSWLAESLARQGYIVAAPDHPGTTTFDRNPVQAALFWERPHDLSRVIDTLTQTPSLAGKVDFRHIAAIGHSLGGWTVMASSGAQFSVTQFLQDCHVQGQPFVCSLANELGITTNNALRTGQTMRDPRIKAVISLDLGLARGFTPESLSTLPIPVLIMGADSNINDLPTALESGYIASHLPLQSSHYVVIPKATHFSFMQRCKPDAMPLLEAEHSGDGIICQDGKNGNRTTIHQQITEKITQFLAATLHK